MASSEEDIRDLFKDYIPLEADLQYTVQKVLEDSYNVRTLLAMSNSEIDDLSFEYFPVGSSGGPRSGFRIAIRRRKEPTQEGPQPSKKATPARDERLSTDERISARSIYFEKLLEPPAELPKSTEELHEFLSKRPAKLPVLHEATVEILHQPKLVIRDTSDGAIHLAVFSEYLMGLMKYPCPCNEATSSFELSNLTGHFLRFLNEEAPEDNKLQGLEFILDSANPTSTSASSEPLGSLLRPDFQLFVRNCLILRWENKIDKKLLTAAVHENTSKLKAWSPLFYGKLPYVIGGCCAGRQFRWLKLFPKGEDIVYEFISGIYDLNMLSDVAKFIQSTIRMHCLLQKLQDESIVTSMCHYINH